MQAINPTEVTDIEAAQKLIGELQRKLYKTENCLDDVVRSVEIAQITRQYQTIDVFMNDAIEMLKDRLVIPVLETNGPNITMVEGSEEAIRQGLDIFNEDPNIEKMKHGEITGHVDLDGNSIRDKK